MKKITTISIVALMLLLVSFKPTDNTTWTLDKAHAKLGFTITHLMVSDVDGWFRIFDAKLTSTKDDFSNAVVELKADVVSINTESEMRDNHLKSPDFFDAAQFPLITFKSKTFEKVTNSSYKVTGDLTMHGITKPVELSATCKFAINPMNKKTTVGFKVTGMIKRSDFIIGTSMGASTISDEVNIIANAEFVKN